ncbi:hypothetical protein QFC20_005845 [Naganishia adeliensis]|uniref:Uncharacterized protein n=1 Tax=Naganishia adeliensis TaxID=92952 RepID=A0ACC2VIL1_9TREE|nr:hypothetical protein QFC20_005845 [Naganishia adeliensis]
MSKTATTGPENPLKTYTDEEKAQITAAETAFNTAMDAFQSARAKGERKERVDELRDVAREKEEVLKGLQDLCD